MKGMIFVHLVDFVEQAIGMEETEQLLVSANLPSGGSYTSVGSYDVVEVATIVGHASEATGLSEAVLYREFGRYLFGELVSSHPTFVAGADDPLTLLTRVERHIHVEVRKLYPDAQLPRFTHTWEEDGSLTLIYESERGLGDLCEGLIRGCFDHFDERPKLEGTPIQGGPLPAVRFSVARE
ncbi:MAG: heme NO-binding domain-containing protein [Proteobacteria bacterium]|nr:heme NO-binding domain-containing protein [Pseudomonadota bacterium]